jgi:hypothetical protein
MIARIELKDGTVLKGNKYINEMLQRVQFVFGDFGVEVAVITSGVDGVHSPNSYHAKERAIDVRSWNVPEDKRLDVAISLRKWLPPFYDVVYEPAVMKDGKIVKGEHYHLEADAKKEAAYNEHLVAKEHKA